MSKSKFRWFDHRTRPVGVGVTVGVGVGVAVGVEVGVVAPLEAW